MQFLIIDDHPMLREGIAALLTRLDEKVLVFQAGDSEQGMSIAAEQAELDAALVDLDIRGQSGLLVVEALRLAHPWLPVIVISASEKVADVRASIAAGAHGYCPKSGSPEALLAAVRMVMSGQIYLPPLMLNAGPTFTERPVLGKNSSRLVAKLTQRQIEVLLGICDGLPNKQIAKQLGGEDRQDPCHGNLQDHGRRQPGAGSGTGAI